MKLLGAALISLLPLIALADTYTMTVDGKTQSLEFKEYQGARLSQSCFKKDKPSCDAFSAIGKKVEETRPDIPLAGHPAAFYCGSAGGNNRILRKNNNDYDFCEFKDKSMVNAWDLYNLAHKK
jgi:hypothetical protein